MEAVIAAVFLDRGITVTRSFIIRLFKPELRKAIKQSTVTDYKSELQEFIQSSEQKVPTYHVIEATGPDHGKTFTVEVRLGNTVLGRGSGKSKKVAETEAARSALEQLPEHFTR